MLECHYSECRKKFKPEKNRKYHCKECAHKARRIKDRVRKRRGRAKEREEKRRERVRPVSGKCLELYKTMEREVPVRNLKKNKKFLYRCDHCQKKIARPAGMLHVYCSVECRVKNRNKRRRMKWQGPEKGLGKGDVERGTFGKKSPKKEAVEKIHGPPLSE